MQNRLLVRSTKGFALRHCSSTLARPKESLCPFTESEAKVYRLQLNLLYR